MTILGIFIQKSKEADYWAGESWRKELINMLVHPADQIVSQLEDKMIA